MHDENKEIARENNVRAEWTRPELRKSDAKTAETLVGNSFEADSFS